MPIEVLITTSPKLKKPKPKETSKKITSKSKPSKPPPKKATTKRGAASSKRALSSSSEDDGDEAPPPRRRRRRLDEEDELESEHIIEHRLRDRSKLSKKDLALLKLKSKRKGITPPVSLNSDSGDSDESDSERDSLFDGSSSDSDVAQAEFIVDDDGAAPASLPKEFSMDAFEKHAHQFKKIFQFFVHIAVRPPVERKEFMEKMLNTEDYFSVPLKATRRRISSLRVTLVASSRWTPAFIELLEQYPNFEVQGLSASKPCDLCHVKSRHGCKAVTLSGNAYEKTGFQEDKSKKRATHKFHFGRFCAQRVTVFHKIAHWEYELFKVIRGEIDQLHELRTANGIVNDRDEFIPAETLWRSGKPPPKDLGDADAINDWLAERSLVDIEYDKIKAMKDIAANIEAATRKGNTD
ncbi:hypothetical protein FB45DRAFT_913019 [Roridomyces roridus]|uniref:DUF4211 domain-containing protein n=1 Tax=Roridomyces roridus TaxID=1738132 RepID=A0AAD7FMQ8_9AGAR|nr:hypothetical protein FB45DRAFT_913019 [Roridomyces roridus]